MEKQTGLKVKAFFAPDYAGIIEGMRFNKVQIAWMGNKSAMEAVDRSNGEVFAQMVNADGTQGYYSHLIVHKDSPLNNLNDMFSNAKNLSFGNGDPNSTSGFLVPGFYVFAQNKVDAKSLSKWCATPTTKLTLWQWPTSKWTWPPTTAKTWTSLKSASQKKSKISRSSGRHL